MRKSVEKIWVLRKFVEKMILADTQPHSTNFDGLNSTCGLKLSRGTQLEGE